MKEKRTKAKIINDEALMELIKNTFAELEVKKNVFEKIEVKRNNMKKKVVFAFRDHRNDEDIWVSDRLANHLCLAFNWVEGDAGGSRMFVADEEDLSQQVIDYIDEHLDHPKRRYEVNEQLSLF